MRNRADLRLDKLRFQVGHIIVSITQPLSFTEANAIDDRRMIELVGDDRVFRAEQRFEQAAVRIEAGGIEDRVVAAEKAGEPAFQLLVRLLGSANEADRRHAVSPPLERFPRGRDHLRMIGQPQVIIGAHVKHLGAIRHPDMRLLRRGKHSLGLIKAGRADRGELRRQMLLECGVHIPDYQLRVAED